LSPADSSVDKATADMIRDGAIDLRQDLIKFRFAEKDEAKKVGINKITGELVYLISQL